MELCIFRVVNFYSNFFVYHEHEKFQRKFDNNTTDDLRILEELYYHTKEDNRYISELKSALIEIGIYDDHLVTKQLTLKDMFKETELYRTGHVFFNKKVPKKYNNVRSFADLGVQRVNYEHQLSSGYGHIINPFIENYVAINENIPYTSKDIKLKNIPLHIIQYALSQLPFFRFDKISRYFPSINSLRDFIVSDDYLGGLSITFTGLPRRVDNLLNYDYLLAVTGLLVALS